MLAKDHERLDTAFQTSVDTLGHLAGQIRSLDHPGIAAGVTAVREVLDHAACVGRFGDHHRCDCPLKLARLELDQAIAQITATGGQA